MKLSATTDFPSLCIENISMSFFASHNFIDLLQDLLPLSTNISFGFQFDSSDIF